MGNDRLQAYGIERQEKFQSTFPRGERLTVSASPALTPRFQSTFPRGERRGIITRNTNLHNFNPRSLVGNDFTCSIFLVSCSIISIHVPSWGTTTGASHSSMGCIYFNPRSLVGNDRNPPTTAPITAISIHVPSWGTTANFHKYSLFFYAINIIFLLFIIPSLFSLVLFMLLF